MVMVEEGTCRHMEVVEVVIYRYKEVEVMEMVEEGICKHKEEGVKVMVAVVICRRREEEGRVMVGVVICKCRVVGEMLREEVETCKCTEEDVIEKVVGETCNSRRLGEGSEISMAEVVDGLCALVGSLHALVAMVICLLLVVVAKHRCKAYQQLP